MRCECLNKTTEVVGYIKHHHAEHVHLYKFHSLEGFHCWDLLLLVNGSDLCVKVHQSWTLSTLSGSDWRDFPPSPWTFHWWQRFDWKKLILPWNFTFLNAAVTGGLAAVVSVWQIGGTGWIQVGSVSDLRTPIVTSLYWIIRKGQTCLPIHLFCAKQRCNSHFRSTAAAVLTNKGCVQVHRLEETFRADDIYLETDMLAVALSLYKQFIEYLILAALILFF